MLKFFVLALCLISLVLYSTAHPLRINEVMSSNSGALTDQSGDTPDWIEIYNYGTSPLNLGGYGLSDKKGKPFQWIFPSCILYPGKYLIVFASGKDLRVGELHTNFKIDADGESVYLVTPGCSLVDSVQIDALKINTSYGRTVKDPSAWAVFTTSTPGKENAGTGFPPGDVGVPVFSLSGGIYSAELKISLRAPGNSDTIYYTLNGSEPTRSSSRVIREISIPTSKVLKARIIKSGMMPGDIVTNSYIIYDNNKLPVVSISMDSLVLFDKVTGMYMPGPNAEALDPHFGANYWQDWERACHFEMMETAGNRVIDLDLGMKIFGNWSRAKAQKSLAFYCRKGYGAEFLKYKIFGERPFDEFKNIVLRNSGNDWNTTMFRDGLMSGLTYGLNMVQMAFRPATIFVNGRYWGILNIREKINEHFIASNYDVKADDVIMLQNNGEVLRGKADDWWKMYNFLDQNSMITTANYEQVASQIDISSFIDYFASQIYFANHDWPGNNIKYWKTTDPASRWRWILFDTDFGMGGYNSYASSNSLASATDPAGPGWPNPPWSTLMLRKLLENREFRDQFVTRFEDLMNSTFLPDRIIKAIDEKSARIDGEIGFHLKRWNGGNQTSWLARVQVMKTFATNRPNYMFTHIQQKFVFQTQQIITVNADSLAGSVQLNSLKLNKFPWKGAYFPNIAITATAIPNAGYRFLRWEGVTTNSGSATIQLAPKANLVLTAVFESDGSHYEDIVINEISFNNDAQPDPGDWIEIYNKGKYDIDLSGWKLTDSDSTHQYVFTPNTWIKSNDYLVVSNDLTKMNAVFGSVKNQAGPFEFGLGNMTDAVRLYSPANELIDEVNYSNVVPWQPFELTESWSLELTNPAKDNNLGQNWVLSLENGTPGLRNTPYILNEIEELPLTQETVVLKQNYPNPFRDGTYIEFELDKPDKYRISVLDVNGRLIRILNDNNQLSTLHSLYWDGTDDTGKPVTSGVYFYRLECNGFSEMKRMVKM